MFLKYFFWATMTKEARSPVHANAVMSQGVHPSSQIRVYGEITTTKLTVVSVFSLIFSDESIDHNQQVASGHYGQEGSK